MISYHAAFVAQLFLATWIAGMGLWLAVFHSSWGFPLAAAGFLLAAATPPTARFISNASAGCFPWSPAEVPYHPHMTLCPGQSVSVPMPLIILPPRRYEFHLDMPIVVPAERRI